MPVWSHCFFQFPPSLSCRKPRRQKHSEETDWADDESEESPPAEPTKKKQRSEATKSSQQSHLTVFHTSVVELSSTSDSSGSDLVLSDSETVTDSDYSDES